MDNPQKQVLYQRNKDGKVQSFSPVLGPDALVKHTGESWTKIGYEQPSDVMLCWFVSEEDVLNSIRKGEPFPYFEPTEYFKRLSWIGSDHIEGYLGHNELHISFHDSIHTSYIYFKDYAQRKNVYLTFDRVALYKVVSIFPEKSNPLRFILKQVTNRNHKKDQAFMIMPFGESTLNELYKDQLKPFLKKELLMDIYRADDFSDNDVIVDTIYRYIEESEFVIADTTYSNKNAFYELGYAAALGTEIIIIQNKEVEQNLFFDRAHIRAILYEPKNLEPFFLELKNTISGIRQRNR